MVSPWVHRTLPHHLHTHQPLNPTTHWTYKRRQQTVRKSLLQMCVLLTTTDICGLYHSTEEKHRRSKCVCVCVCACACVCVHVCVCVCVCVCTRDAVTVAMSCWLRVAGGWYARVECVWSYPTDSEPCCWKLNRLRSSSLSKLIRSLELNSFRIIANWLSYWRTVSSVSFLRLISSSSVLRMFFNFMVFLSFSCFIERGWAGSRGWPIIKDHLTRLTLNSEFSRCKSFSLLRHSSWWVTILLNSK